MVPLYAHAGRSVYRVRQFVAALRAGIAPLGPDDLSQAQSYLPVTAWPLFLSMARGDQQHSLNVLRTLQQRGQLNPILAQAALLHDCAKHGEGVRLWHRVAVVLLAVLAPSLLSRWAKAAPSRDSWRYPFWAHLNHPQRGAALAGAAGCDPLAVSLIAHHQNHSPGRIDRPEILPWLAELQAADDDN